VLRALIAAAMLAMAGCARSSVTTISSPSVPATSMQVLKASAVPGIPYTTRVLTATELAKDASITGLASKIVAWGYLDGRERTFQGESRHLTLVVSRSLIFKGATEARSFVAYIHANATAFFGGAVGEQALLAQGRSGWLFTPAPCACHLASPVVVGVLDAGTGVVWLSINGPDATPGLLMSLLDPGNSVPANT